MYVFEFTSEYIKRPVENSDFDRQLLKERKVAILSSEISKPIKEIHEILSEYAARHVRCVAENF